MTGPPYPRYPAGTGPGENAIGSFVIGVSPLGDIAAFDPWVTIISQYANSPIIDDWITSFNAAMDQTANIDNFYDLMWNVLTAQGYGLDVWGRIVGVTRVVQVPNSTTGAFFGFEEAAGSWTGFGPQIGGGPFFGGSTITTTVSLSDTDFRRLVLAKAAGNISNGSIPSVNAILLALFPNRGDCFVQDNLNMSVTYIFKFTLTPTELAIVTQSGVLPTAAGVSYSISSKTS